MWSIETYEVLGSTQDTLKALKNPPEGQVIVALEQTAGRGRHGRKWDGQSGNLFFSFVLEPRCDIGKIGVLALLCAVGVYEGVSCFLNVEGQSLLSLKWPNDLLIGSEKCGGILIESELGNQGRVEKLFVGIGINTVAAPESQGCALRPYVRNDMSSEGLLHAVLKRIEAVYAVFQQGQGQQIINMWLERGHDVGDKLTVKQGDIIHEGSFQGLDEYGGLLLSLEGNIKRITAGDVYLA